MGRRTLLAIMLLGVALVMAISLGILRHGRLAILEEFQSVQSKLSQTVTSDLRGHLESFDKDTRLAAALAEKTRSQHNIDVGAQDQVIQAAFVAQVTVVKYYRTIALYSRSGAPPIVAVDPTEDTVHIAPALIAAGASAAKQVLDHQRANLLGPISLGADRFFYLYSAPAGPGEAVVVSVDATMMLQVVGRWQGGTQTMVVVDPNGATWLGCDTPTACRLHLRGTDGERRIGELLRPASSTGRAQREHEEGAPPSLPGRVVIGMGAPMESPLGRWSVALITSAAGIEAHEERLALQLLLTSAAVIATILTLGFFIARQQANAAALQTRLQAAQEIANLRERSERILENVPAGILGVTAEGRLAMANRFFLQRIQKQARLQHAAIGLPGWTLRLFPHIARALSSRRTQILTDRELTEGGSEPRDYDVRIIPLDQPADDVAALVLVEDLSELHDLQRQLVRAEKLVTVGVLSAGIAHEIGTPLTVIRGRAEHLLESAGDGPAAQSLRAIVAQIDHISSTIRQILEFCRTEPIQAGVADVRVCVLKAVKLLEWRFRKRRIAVQQRFPGDLPEIAADPEQFEQMVVNLLTNACDASPEGALIDVVAEVDRSHPNRLRLEVIDHGAGIAPEHVNTVFDPYFTTKKRGEGTGLGLAIVAHIVHLHRGEVTLVSALGDGTTATVLWPIAPKEGAAIA